MSTIIKHKEFTNHKVYKTEVAGRPLTIDVGKVAELAPLPPWSPTARPPCWWPSPCPPAPGTAWTSSPSPWTLRRSCTPWAAFPAPSCAGRGQPSLPAVLASRVIDRSIRPLFPYDFRNDVVVTATVMSVDRDCSPEVTAMIGVSACLAYSCIPWAGPIGCLEVGYCDGEIVLNPNQEQRKTSAWM